MKIRNRSRVISNSFFIKSLLIFLIALIFSSCNKSEKQMRIEREKAREVREIIEKSNEYGAKNLIQKYDALKISKEKRYFSYYYQEELIDRKRLLCIEGKLFDIFKTDSTYYLHIMDYRCSDSYFVCDEIIDKIAIISLNLLDFEKILGELHSSNKKTEGCFIIKVSHVIVPLPVLRKEVDIDSSEETPYYYYIFDYDKDYYIIKGELVDFYLQTKYD